MSRSGRNAHAGQLIRRSHQASVVRGGAPAPPSTRASGLTRLCNGWPLLMFGSLAHTLAKGLTAKPMDTGTRYVARNADGGIVAVFDRPHAAAPEQLKIQDPELVAFVTGGASDEALRQNLLDSRRFAAHPGRPYQRAGGQQRHPAYGLPGSRAAQADEPPKGPGQIARAIMSG